MPRFILTALGAALVLLVLAGCPSGKTYGGKNPLDEKSAPAEEGDGSTDKLAQADEFWAAVEEHKPVFMPVARTCPVDGTKLTTYDKSSDNRYGGVATDLMKIALSPAPEPPAPPVLDRQEFDLLLGTCPECKATFIDQDIVNLEGDLPAGGLDRLKKWNNVAEARSLAALDSAKLRYDQRHVLRYLTLRQAGFPDHELGFCALAGAYSCNLSTYLGRESKLTAAAFYALAAAHFESYLSGGEMEGPEARAIVAMTVGEVHRLLGRGADATAALDKARQGDYIDERTKKIVDHLAKLTTDGDFTLQRAPLEGVPDPPVGWYIDTMLPAINGELDVQRSKWAAVTTPERALELMLADL